MKPIKLFQCEKCKKIYSDYETADKCCKQINSQNIEKVKNKLIELNTFSNINSKEKYIKGILLMKEVQEFYKTLTKEERIELILEYETSLLNIRTKLSNYYEKIRNEILFMINNSDFFTPIEVDDKVYKICDSEDDIINMLTYTYILEETIKELNIS